MMKTRKLWVRMLALGLMAILLAVGWTLISSGQTLSPTVIAVSSSLDAATQTTSLITAQQLYTCTIYLPTVMKGYLPPGAISGKVTESDGVTPISGAEVFAIEPGGGFGFATTATGGTYLIDGLVEGIYEVSASAPGFVRASQSGIAVVAGQVTPNVDFSLSRAGAISGNVVDAFEDAYIAGIEVIAIDKFTGIVIGQDITDENGNFAITDLPSGTYLVDIVTEDYAGPGAIEVTIRDDEQVDGIDFALVPLSAFEPTGETVIAKPFGFVAGRVVDQEQGNPVAEARVVIHDADRIYATMTDDEGRFEFSDIPSGGRKHLVVSHQDYVAYLFTFDLWPGEIETLEISLVPSSATVPIGSDGGTVTGDNDVSVFFPEGAVTTPIEVAVNVLEPNYLYEYIGVPPSVENLFPPVNLEPSGVEFNEPVVVVVPLSIPVRDDTLTAGLLDLQTLEVTPIVGTVIDGGTKVAFEISHFSWLDWLFGIYCEKIDGTEWNNKPVNDTEFWPNKSCSCSSPQNYSTGSWSASAGVSYGVGSVSVSWKPPSATSTCKPGPCKRCYLTAVSTGTTSGYMEHCLQIPPSVEGVLMPPIEFDRPHYTVYNVQVTPGQTCENWDICTGTCMRKPEHAGDACWIPKCQNGDCVDVKKQCPPDEPHCKSPSGDCVQCLTNAHCPPSGASHRTECINNVCQCPSNTPVDCYPSEGEWCCPQDYVCVSQDCRGCCPAQKPDCVQDEEGNWVCSSQGGGSMTLVAPPDGAIAASVSPGGGELSFDNDAVTVVVPPGAVSASTLIIYTPQPTILVAGFVPVKFFTLEAYTGGCQWQKVTDFNKPVTIQVSYSPEETAGIDESKLGLYYFDNTLNEWVALEAVVDPAGDSVTVNELNYFTLHFTLYALMAPAEAAAD